MSERFIASKQIFRKALSLSQDWGADANRFKNHCVSIGLDHFDAYPNQSLSCSQALRF